MATCKSAADCFEDLVFCPVCLEIYKDPQSLLCRHSLCITCVDKLTKEQRVKCPICRKKCDIKDVVADFNTAKYVEFYNVNELDEIASTRKCQACCIYTASDDVYYCLQCSQSMLTALSKQTDSEVAKNITKRIQTSLNETKLKLEQKSGLFSTWLHSVENEIVKLKQTEKMVSLWNGMVNEKLEKLVSLISSEDDTLLIENGEIMNQDVINTLDILDTQVESQKELLDSCGIYTLKADDFIAEPRLAQRSGGCNKETAMASLAAVTESTQPMNLPTIEPILPSYPPRGWTQTVHNTPGYHTVTTYTLVELRAEEAVYSLTIANDRLLLISDQCVYVYDRSCKLQNKITFSNYDGCRNVIKRGAGPEAHLIAGGTNGLMTLNMKGRIKYKITSRTINHMTTYRHHIYALNRGLVGGDRSIQMYEKFKEWQCVQTYTVRHKNPSEYDTLGVAAKNFYVCSYDNHCIYCFNPAGEMIHRIGKHGEEERSNVPGRFFNPRLVNIDCERNLLIADIGNKRIQKRSATGDWSVVSTEVGKPWDVVMDGDLMWVLTQDGQLLKFSK